MKILLVGSGGREHALAWKLSQSDRCGTLYCAPGNAGIENVATCVNVAANDVDGIVAFSQDNAIDFVVVGPEAPLVLGLGDRLREAGIKVFGPSAKAAQLEGSKGFMKDIARKYNVPTARYERFTEVVAAKAFIDELGAPIVIKTDGLAAGKGVIISETVEHAKETVEEMLSGAMFGDAGSEIVIEEFLTGEEASYFAFSDGKNILGLTSAQDHKRVGDGDTGPNTGGMGAYSPAHFWSDELEQKVLNDLIQPTVDGMAAEGCPFTGILFAGLMIENNEPKLIEYNIRFGDPECQEIMMRLEGDLVTILEAAADGRLDEIKQEVKWSDRVAMCIVLAANGYPGAYAKNTVIENIEAADAMDDVVVFHAGTAKDEQGRTVNTGGRVMGVTAMGDDFAQAQKLAYEAVAKIKWADGFYRKDIGWRAIESNS